MTAPAKIGWAERLANVRDQWPQTGHNRDQILDSIADYDRLGQVMRDVLRVGYEPPRRGQRSPLEWSDGHARLRSLAAENAGMATTMPFPDAYARLADGHSADAMADTTGILPERLTELADGSDPTGDEMEAIAKAFGKPLTYFLEYRVELIASTIVASLYAAPERTIDVLVRLGVHPEG